MARFSLSLASKIGGDHSNIEATKVFRYAKFSIDLLHGMTISQPQDIVVPMTSATRPVHPITMLLKPFLLSFSITCRHHPYLYPHHQTQ